MNRARAARNGGRRSPDRIILQLFIAGRTLRSESAVTHLRDICERRLSGRYELRIVDVIEQPELAEREKILATPTLIRLRPDPVRRVIGDMTAREAVLTALDLNLELPGETE